MENTSRKSTAISVNSVGFVHAVEQEGKYEICIFPAFRPALKQLDQFGHVIVVWWADQHDTTAHRNILVTELPYAPGIQSGIFACRSEYRPNPIALTTMPILYVDEENGVVALPWIDTYDGSPVLDLKPYLPVSDRIRDVSVAAWMQDWPGWMEEAGAYFAAKETDFGK